MKKVISIVLIVSVCIAFLSFSVFLIWNHLTDYNTILKANWGISIPYAARYREIYDKDSGSSFHADGVRYHIFSYKNQSYIEEMLEWESYEKGTIFYGNYSDTLAAWLDEIEVPSKYRPECSCSLFLYSSQTDNSEIIIVWNNKNSLLYVAESFL